MHFKGSPCRFSRAWASPPTWWCGSRGSSDPRVVLPVSGHIGTIAQDEHRSVNWGNMEMPALPVRHPLQSQPYRSIFDSFMNKYLHVDPKQRLLLSLCSYLLACFWLAACWRTWGPNDVQGPHKDNLNLDLISCDANAGSRPDMSSDKDNSNAHNWSPWQIFISVIIIIINQNIWVRSHPQFVQ